MNSSNIKKTVVLVTFLVAACFVFMTPIRDNDFFWHLATGKWIAEHRELPQTDPFSYTELQKDEFQRGKFILKGYWLANLIQYGFFLAAGYNGIIALRVLIILLTLLVVGAHMRKKGLNFISALLLLNPILLVLAMFKGDRPNQMTFLFTALFMYLADAAKRGEKKGYLLPLVIIVWANLHGGFLLGAVIAFLMVVSEVIKKLLIRGYALNRRLVTVILITIVAGALNPNDYAALYNIVFKTSKYYSANIAETQTPWSFTKLGKFSYVLIPGISLFIAAWYFISRISSRPIGTAEKISDICDELLIVIFLAGLSFTAIRYIPLFTIVLAPLVAPLFAGKFQNALKRLSVYHVPELLISAVSLWLIYVGNSYTVLNRPLVDRQYPDDAVQFIKQKDMKGRFFNYYDWGGYLIWQFYPEPFVFIDGRGLSANSYYIYRAIVGDSKETLKGVPIYKAYIEAYSVRHIIIPSVDMFGQMINVLVPLVNDPEWRLVYVGRESLVFTKDRIEPAYDKTMSYKLAISNAVNILKKDPNNPLPYLTYARANSYLGRQKTAISALEVSLQRIPSLRGGPVEEALNLLKEKNAGRHE